MATRWSLFALLCCIVWSAQATASGLILELSKGTPSWTVEVALGKPVQRVRLAVATETPDSWVFASSPERCDPSRHVFDRKASETWTPKLVFAVTPTYLAFLEGSVGLETVGDDGWTLPSHWLGLSPNTTVAFSGSWACSVDGLLGLGVHGSANGFHDFDSEAGIFLGSLFTYKLVQRRVFAFQPHQLTLGTFRTDVGVGFTALPIVEPGQGRWMVQLDSFFVETFMFTQCTPATLSKSASCGVEFGSGSPYTLIPRRMWTEFISRLERHRVDCRYEPDREGVSCEGNSTVDLPTVSFMINGRLYSLDGEDYVVPATNGRSYLLFAPRPSLPDEAQSTKHIKYRFVLGQPFLKEFYTVFDADTPQILLEVPHTSPHLTAQLIGTTLAWGLGVPLVVCVVVFVRQQQSVRRRQQRGEPLNNAPDSVDNEEEEEGGRERTR